MDLSNLAIQKALNNQWEEAIGINQQLLDDNPQNIEALNRLAQAHFQLGNLPKAQKLYFQVLKNDRFNPIAKRNLTKIKALAKNGQTIPCNGHTKALTFIEEPGKSKVISLVRLGDLAVRSQLQPCTPLDIQFKNHAVYFYYQKQYLGRLPDDIAKRLIWLCKRKNCYQAFVKLVEKNKLSIFIKETKRSLQNRSYPSFQLSDTK